MTEPVTTQPKSKAKTYLLATSLVLALLTVLGFNRGWLAWHSDQRPVGKLRPADLVSSPSSSVPADAASETSSSIPGSTVTAGASSTTGTALATSTESTTGSTGTDSTKGTMGPGKQPNDDHPTLSTTADPTNPAAKDSVTKSTGVETTPGNDSDHDADD